MVRVQMPYGSETLAFDVPRANLVGRFAPHSVQPVADVAAEIARALAQPIGGPALRELAHGARDVVIVADDHTRLTPTDIIVPLLLDQLNAAGVTDEQIEVIIALGTHRAMTRDEIEHKFGRQVVDRVAVRNHEPFSPEALVDLGTTPGGVAVRVLRRVVDADLVIGVGTIVPHHIPGFSGGAKIIQPGVCGERTTGEVHLLSVRHEESLMGVVENQVRHEMEEIAERAGLRAILNTVLDPQGRTIGAVYGDPRMAFREGVALSRQVYGVQVPQQADIVVAGSHPCDSEFWQAHKTLYPAEMCVRPGGTIILVTPCPEGVTATHADVLDYAALDRDVIDGRVRAGEIGDITGAALSLAWANARCRATVSMVSDGITAEEKQALAFRHFASVSDALDDAFARHGADASVIVLPYAPDTLPLLA